MTENILQSELTCLLTDHSKLSSLNPLPVKLVVVVGVACLDVLLTTVKDGLGRQELSKDAADGPNI